MPAYDEDGFDWDSVFGGGGEAVSDVPYWLNENDESVSGNYPYDPGDNIDAGGGWNPGSGGGGGGWDWLTKLLGGGGGGGKGGGFDLMSLLPLLLAGGAGAYGLKQNKDAGKDIKAAADKASDESRLLLGGARDDFKPYMEGGTKALGMVFDKLNGPGLAEKYATPVAKYPGSDLKGTVSLHKLMGK
jgi:hypothetical protein